MAAEPQMIIRIAANLEELKRNLAEGKAQIETTTAAMSKMAKAMSGDALIQSAHNIVASINQIGGASKLTEAEQARYNVTLEKAVEKLRVMGKEVPAAMIAAANDTRKLTVQVDEAAEAISKMARGFSGADLIEEAKRMVAAVQQVGGATRLNEADQARVNATLTKAIAQYELIEEIAPKAMRDIATETTQTKQQTEQLGVATSKTSAFFSDFGTQLKATILGFVSAQAIIGTIQQAWRSFTAFLSSSVEEWAKQEAAIKKVEAALRTQGTAVAPASAAYQKLASEFQKTTVYADDLTMEMQGLLIQVGNVLPGQMKAALQASMDLASGLGVDLNTATLLVAKAFAGNTSTLSRYGIVLDQSRVKAEGATYVLEQLQDKFGGQAQAEAETYSGKVKQLGNAWSDFKEAVGGAITQNEIVQASLRHATEAMQAANDKTVDTSGSWTTFDVALRQASPTLHGIYRVLTNVSKAANDAADGFARASAGTQWAKPGYGGWGLSSLALPVVPPGMSDELDRVAEAWKRQIAAVKEAEEAHKKAAAEMQRFRDSVTSLSYTFMHHNEVIQPVIVQSGEMAEALEWLNRATIQATHDFGGFVGLMPAVESNMDSLATATETVAQKAMRAFAGLADTVGQVFQGTTAVVLDAVKVMANAISTILAALARGDWVTAIIAGGSAVLHFFGLFDASVSDAVRSAEELRVAFYEASGGLAELHRKAELAGVSLSGLFTQDPEAVQQAIEDIIRGLQEWQERIDALKGGAAGIGDALTELAKPFTAKAEELAGIREEWTKQQGVLTGLRGTMQAAEQAFTDYANSPGADPKRVQELASAWDKATQAVIDQEEAIRGLEGQAGATQQQLRDMAGYQQGDFERLGSMALGSFGAILKETGSITEAFEASGGSLDTLIELMDRFGFTATGALAETINSWREMKANMDLLTGAEGVGKWLAGMEKAKTLTQDQFQTAGAQARSYFDSLKERGIAADKAMAMMQPTLQTLWELQKKHGFAVNETTQALINEAEKQGLVGDNAKDVNDKILDVLTDIKVMFGQFLVAAMQTFEDKAGATTSAVKSNVETKVRDPLNVVGAGLKDSIPWDTYEGHASATTGNIKKYLGNESGVGRTLGDFHTSLADPAPWKAWAATAQAQAETAARSIEMELGGIHVPTVVIPTTYGDPGSPPGGGGKPMASGGDFWVTKPTTFLVGEAGPERAMFSGANRDFASTGGGGPVSITINALDAQSVESWLRRGGAQQITRAIAPELPAELRRRGVPA